MKSIRTKTLKQLLLWGLMIGGSIPALAIAATPTQSFSIYGQAQILEGPIRLSTPFIGKMKVDPNYKDPSFGQVGRVTSISISFPLLWTVPAFNAILTQGPEISGITPLKYDVTVLNAKGQQVQIQFTTLESPATYPGFGTPVGSLVDFRGGSFMQGSNSGPLEIGYGLRQTFFLQRFHGFITASR